MKWTPGTVTSVMLFQLRANSRAAPRKIAPGAIFRKLSDDEELERVLIGHIRLRGTLSDNVDN